MELKVEIEQWWELLLVEYQTNEEIYELLVQRENIISFIYLMNVIESLLTISYIIMGLGWTGYSHKVYIKMRMINCTVFYDCMPGGTKNVPLHFKK